MKSRFIALAFLVPVAVSAGACREPELTTGEALQAVEEASVSGDAENVTSGSIEISTDFTIGQAAEAAAKEIQAFITTQLPCAGITLTGATLKVEYGKNPGLNCTYKGNTYSGTHEITVTKNDMADVIVNHTWTKLSNGRVEVTGKAEVTWSGTEKSRHVVHELEWTRLSDGKTGKGTGDRVQKPLEGGLVEGFQVDGSRSWTAAAGTWDLDIEGVQFRWVDPVPQAGKYTLVTPKDQTVTLSFERVDEDTIKATLASGTKTFTFNVSKTGKVSGEGA